MRVVLRRFEEGRCVVRCAAGRRIVVTVCAGCGTVLVREGRVNIRDVCSVFLLRSAENILAFVGFLLD